MLNTDRITLSGQVHTQHPPEAVRVSFGQGSTTPSRTATEGIYRFELPDVPLVPGQNTLQLQVQTPDKSAQAALTLTHTPDNADALPPPLLSVVSPVSGRLLNDVSFRLRGHVSSQGGPVSLSINGRPYVSARPNLSDYDFDELISFAEGQDVVTVQLEAQDSLGKQSRLELSYARDGQAPQFLLDNDLRVAPALNPVLESPYTLSGTVRDSHLASLTLNDQPIVLRPGEGPGIYRFTAAVRLAPNAEVPLAWVARDLAGNRTAVEYRLVSQAAAALTPLLPGEGAAFVSQGAPLPVQVAVRLSEEGAGRRVQAQVEGGPPVTLTLSGTLASGELELPAASGDYRITYQLFDGERLLASSTRAVSVQAAAAIPLQLSRHEPANGEGNVEPTQAVELYFNKAIEPGKLSLQVRETLHGETYVNLDPLGSDFLNAKGYQLQAVHRDREAVPGSVSVLPGNQSLAFYPARHFGFAAEVSVDVNYDGQELGRFVFQVRPLPTFVMGGVMDQFGQPLQGIPVRLGDTGRQVTTNNDGSFAFGFGEAAGREIPGGRHRLIVNPDLATPGYGSQVVQINLQAQRRNDLGIIRLPELHPDVPFQRIASGQAVVSLADDALQLDLSEARLLFGNGRLQGEVQMQFFPFEQLTAPVLPGALPLWAYAAQPRGVQVEGPVGITLRLPRLQGGYDYLLPGTEYVLLLGFDAERNLITPIGLGRIDEHSVHSVGKLPLTSLDYLGYAQVEPRLQDLLRAIAQGERPFHDLLSELR